MAIARNLVRGTMGIALLCAPLLAAHAQTNQYWNSSGWEHRNWTPRYTQQYQTYQYPTPSCTISITTPNNYSSSAVPATISWTTENASSAYLPGAGVVNPEGAASTYAYPGETFTLTVSNPGGSANCQVQYNPYAQYQQYESYQPYQSYEPYQQYSQYQTNPYSYEEGYPS